MPKYMVNCRLPHISEPNPESMRGMVQRANDVLRVMSGSETHWIECHVTADRCHWIYLAPDEVMVREHARRSGLIVERIMEITQTFDPTSA